MVGRIQSVLLWLVTQMCVIIITGCRKFAVSPCFLVRPVQQLAPEHIHMRCVRATYWEQIALFVVVVFFKVPQSTEDEY